MPTIGKQARSSLAANLGSRNDICVFTPTYNRGYCLPALYESLLGQTTSHFNWLIVDDGSTDDTEALVDGWIKDNRLAITYVKQENAGKQIAHNTGVGVSTSELFFCVDSDDQLVPDALEAIWNAWLPYRDNPRVAGVIANQGPDASHPHKNGMPPNVELLTMWDLYYRYGHQGDTAHIYRTDVLARYPFEIEDGEKFIGETFVYHQIDEDHVLVPLDKVVTIQEYLEDGYSRHVRKLTRENPKGYRKLKRMYIEWSQTPYIRLHSTILYMVGCLLCGEGRQGIKDAPNPVLAALVSPAAWVLAKTEFQKN